MPGMTDDRFRHGVIYLCAHSAEGAMGILVNRRLREPDFDDLLVQLKVGPTPPVRRLAMCSGGPVDNARGFVLHSSDWLGDGSLRVGTEIALTASLDILGAIAAGGGPAQATLALGYAGWGPGQLEDEISQNAWLSAPVDTALLFDADHDTKWRRALAVLGVDPALLSAAVGHA